jgi:hypothetical protein
MIQIDLGLDLEVEFDVCRGYPATRDHIGEPPYIVITSVQYNGQNLELTDGDLDRLTEMLYDQGVLDDDGY